MKISSSLEGIAKRASQAKFDDFLVGSVSRKVTYPIGHRHFARNPNPTKKARIWLEWSFAIPSLFFAIVACLLSSPFELESRQSSNYYSDSSLEELRQELADVKHELKSVQVDLNLLDERVQKSATAPKNTTELSQLGLKISTLEKKASQIDFIMEKISADLRSLNTNSTQTLNKIHDLEQEIAAHDKKLDEVVKLKGTLTSISKAIGQTTPPVSNDSKTYRVKAGDSLEKIARNQHVSVDALKKLNQLKDDKIIVGQELKVSDDSR